MRYESRTRKSFGVFHRFISATKYKERKRHHRMFIMILFIRDVSSHKKQEAMNGRLGYARVGWSRLNTLSALGFASVGSARLGSVRLHHMDYMHLVISKLDAPYTINSWTTIA